MYTQVDSVTLSNFGNHWTTLGSIKLYYEILSILWTIGCCFAISNDDWEPLNDILNHWLTLTTLDNSLLWLSLLASLDWTKQSAIQLCALLSTIHLHHSPTTNYPLSSEHQTRPACHHQLTFESHTSGLWWIRSSTLWQFHDYHVCYVTMDEMYL